MDATRRSHWTCGLLAAALLALAPAARAADDPPADDAPVKVNAGQLQDALFVAGDTTRLDTAGAGDVLAEKVLQEMYAVEPDLPPAEAAVAPREILHFYASRLSPTGFAIAATNGEIMSDLAILETGRAEIERNLTPDARAAFDQALARVAGQALSASNDAVPGGAFDPQIDSESTLSSNRFSPQQVLIDTAETADRNAKFGTARDQTWQSVSRESVYDSSARLFESNPALKDNADLRATIDALGDEQHIDTTWGRLRTGYANVLHGLQANTLGTGALIQDYVHGVQPLALVQAGQAAAAITLRNQQGTLSMLESFTKASGLKGSPKLIAQRALDIAGQRMGGMVTGQALNVAVTGIDPAMAVGLITQIPDMINSIISAINDDPSPDEIILEQLQVIQQQITALSQQVESGFAVVDAQLGQLAATLVHDTNLLVTANANLTQIRQDMTRLQDSMDAIQSDLFQVAQAQRNEQLDENVRVDIGYSRRAPGGAAMPADRFAEGAGIFFAWAHDFPFDAISEIPSPPSSFQPDNVFAQLSASGFANALNANIDYLGRYPAVQGWGPALGTNLPNPDVWAAGARAFAQLALENPQYVTPGVLDELDRIQGLGSGLDSALAGIRRPGPAVDGFDTGSGLLNHALANYVDQGVTSAGGLLDSLSREETGWLASLPPAGDPNCTSCDLASPPSGDDPGARYIDLWGGPDQAQHPHLTPLWSTSDPNRDPPNGNRGTANACGGEASTGGITLSAGRDADILLNPLPNAYATAWHLGLGRITSTCYTARWLTYEGHVPDFPNTTGTLQVTLNWFWNGGATPAFSVTAITPDQRICKSGPLPVGQSDPDAEVRLDWSRGSNPHFADDCPSVPNGYTLEPVFKALAERVAALTPPASASALSCLPPPPGATLCGYTFADPAPVRNAAAATLTSLQRQVYSDIAPPNQPLTSSNHVSAAATRLSGARALVDDYVKLGLPVALSSDPGLRAAVYGPAHLLDEDGIDNDIYAYFRGAIASPPASDPAGTGGPLEQLMRQGAANLAGLVAANLAPAPPAAGARAAAQAGAAADQTDPLIAATVARVGLTKYVIENLPEPTPPPPPPPCQGDCGGGGGGGGTPVVPPRPALKLVKAARAKGSTVRFTLACSGAACRATATETTTEKLRGRRVISIAAKRRTVRVGSRRFTIAAGRKKTVVVTLNATGRRLLGRYHRLPLRLTIALAGQSRPVARAKLTLKAPRHR